MQATQTYTAREILVPGAPDIPGLRFRGFAGDDDFARMARVIDLSKTADKTERTETPEDLARNYAHVVNCDLERDMLMVELDGQLIGYNRMWWMQEDGGPRLYGHVGFIAPEARRRGIGRAVFHYIENHLRQMAASQGFDGARFMQTDATDKMADREALLKECGYAPVRYGYSMVRPLAEPVEITPMPDGLEVRPVAAEQSRAVWDADVEAFRDHWGYVEPPEAEYQNFISSPVFNPALWKIAFDTASGEIAGMVLNFVAEAENKEYQRRRGYTEGISVRRPWRKRGLARALLTRSMQMFKDMGMTEAALGVDAQNPNGALNLYESVGFQVVFRDTAYRKPLD